MADIDVLERTDNADAVADFDTGLRVVRDAQARKLLGVGKSHYADLKASGIFEIVALGKRVRGITLRSLRQFIENGGVTSRL